MPSPHVPPQNFLPPVVEPPTPSRKRLARTPGLAGTNAAFLVPEHIRKKFVDGWNVHIPLTYLTDKGCLVKEKFSSGTSQDVLTIDNLTGQLLTSFKPLSDDGELDLTFDEWHQAWRRLLDLIKVYVSDKFPLWEIHYSFILNSHNRAELWPLYLAYDTKIRRRAMQLSIDPSHFSIGIWNDLESRYTAKKILSLVQADMKSHPNTRPSPTPWNTNKNNSFHSQRSQFQQADSAKPYRCIFCGDRSKSHTSRNCLASTNTSGSPCHLLRQGSSGLRVSKAGKNYCFAWNGLSGCDNGTSCQRGEHWCTLCGTTAHNAQTCNEFSDVPISIQFGFDMGISTLPTHSFTPPNHKSALSFPTHVMSHISTELSSCRYSGPFSKSKLESLIGLFCTSPLGTVPKSELSDERWIIQDLSFPRDDPSRRLVNDHINIDNFRCNWGTFNDVKTIVLDAPPGTKAVTLNVDSAFRCCPIVPSQQPNFVVHWNNLFYIDHNAPFGTTSSGGVFGP